jgi:hypothetical protein
MSSSYRKIKYQEEGPYGSWVDKYLYIWSHNTVDVTHVFDENGEQLFCYSETGFDMSQALVVAFTNWNDERMENMTREEIDLIKNQNKDD